MLATVLAGREHGDDDEGQWVDAGDLEVGDQLEQADGSSAVVDGVESRREVVRVHNLTVEGIHTFYVLAGNTELLVHNCGTQPVGFAQGAAESALEKVGRVDHASIHPIGEGIVAGAKGSNAAREGFRTLARRILEQPNRTFDHVMSRSGQRVKGFVGSSGGRTVVIFVAKEHVGKIGAGDIVTALVPSPQEAWNWGVK